VSTVPVICIDTCMYRYMHSECVRVLVFASVTILHIIIKDIWGEKTGEKNTCRGTPDGGGRLGQAAYRGSEKKKKGGKKEKERKAKIYRDTQDKEDQLRDDSGAATYYRRATAANQEKQKGKKEKKEKGNTNDRRRTLAQAERRRILFLFFSFHFLSIFFFTRDKEDDLADDKEAPHISKKRIEDKQQRRIQPWGKTGKKEKIKRRRISARGGCKIDPTPAAHTALKRPKYHPIILLAYVLIL